MPASQHHDELDFECPSVEAPSAPNPLHRFEMELEAERELERSRGIDGLGISDRRG